MADKGEFEHELVFPSDTAEGMRVQDLILQKLREHQFSEKIIFGVRLSLEEALVNAIKHGNGLDRAKTVRVRFTVNPHQLLVEIEDQGPGFRPEDVPDPTAPENLERPCGRGLLLMRSYMTECQFLAAGNICRMRRVREE
jgi:serine/threonine-protein kinase RsbW